MGGLRGLFAAYGATISSLIYGLASAAILTRVLTLSDYGVWSQYRVVCGLLATTLSLNMGHGFLRFAAAADVERRKIILSRMMGLQLTLVAAVLLIGLPFADPLGEAVFDRPGTGLWLAAAAWAALMMIQSLVVNSLLIRQRAATAYGIMTGYRFVALGALGFLMIWPSVDAAIVISLSTLAGVTAVLAFLVRKDLAMPRPFDYGPLADVLKFCLPLLPIQPAMWVVASSDRFFLKHYDGLEAVGRYSLVYTFAALIPAIYTAVSALFLAAVVPWYEERDMARVGRAFGLAIRAYWTVGLAMVLGLYLGAEPIITWLSGPDYLFEGLQEVALLVGLGGFVHGLFIICSRLFDLKKRSWSVSGTWVLAMVLNLGANALLIPGLGLTGAALATVSSYVVALCFALAIRPREVTPTVKPIRLAGHAAGLVLIAIGIGTLAAGQGLGVTFALATSAGVLAILWSLGSGVLSLGELRTRGGEPGPRAEVEP